MAALRTTIRNHRQQNPVLLLFTPLVHIGDKRIISGHLDFHNYEDFGTSSTNLTRYLFEDSRRSSMSQQ